MKKFILKSLLFLILLLLLISPLLFFKIGGDSWRFIDNPTALIIDKANRIKSLKSPKLIIAGGSSSFFGINSELIEREFPYNIVNMAQFGSFGLKFILDQTSDCLNKRDVVFLNPEYFLNVNIKNVAQNDILRYYPDAQKYLKDSKVTYIDQITSNFQNNVESIFAFVLKPMSQKSPIFKHSREANVYGDAIGYLRYESPKTKAKFPKLTYRYYEGIDLIKKYIDLANKQEAKVYVIFPPISRSAYLQNSKVIEHLYNDMAAKFGDRILCTPSEMVFDDSLFFDTESHLDKNGREIRTKRLISFFKRKQIEIARNQ